VTELPRNTILSGDACDRLRDLPADSIDCVITSPPYFQLRDYGVSGQLGQEATVDEWVAGLRAVFREVRRVLKPAGSVWLNLGDSFSRHVRYGAAPKSLLLGPEKLVIGLAADGWIVRNKVIWTKSNPMPTSVTDRLALTWEPVYFLVRSRRYFYDLNAIREPHRTVPTAPRQRATIQPSDSWASTLAASRGNLARYKASGQPGHPGGKNPGDSWALSASNYRGAHFATFPEALVRRPILATCPARVCARCGAAQPRPGCGCRAPFVPGIVCDPFLGSGTVAVVARRLGRDWLGIELNPDYVRLAEQRLGIRPDLPPERAGPSGSGN
jgi:site-specific DNA-methyltransferase (adenine-specific)